MIVNCNECGKAIERSKPRAHNFCCMEHLRSWNARRFAAYNRTENPLNKRGGTIQNRMNQHKAKTNRGEGKTYRVFYGRAEHRVIAEAMLERALAPGEVVHHTDGNKRNNDPCNLEVLPSQSEHCKRHGFGHKRSEVMTNDHI